MRDRNGNKSHTLAEIGEELGVTRERVRQIEAGALRKLAKHPLAKQLREALQNNPIAFTDTVRDAEIQRAWERVFEAQDRTDSILRRPLPVRPYARKVA